LRCSPADVCTGAEGFYTPFRFWVSQCEYVPETRFAPSFRTLVFSSFPPIALGTANWIHSDRALTVFDSLLLLREFSRFHPANNPHQNFRTGPHEYSLSLFFSSSLPVFLRRQCQQVEIQNFGIFLPRCSLSAPPIFVNPFRRPAIALVALHCLFSLIVLRGSMRRHPAPYHPLPMFSPPPFFPRSSPTNS